MEPTAGTTAVEARLNALHLRLAEQDLRIVNMLGALAAAVQALGTPPAATVAWVAALIGPSPDPARMTRETDGLIRWIQDQAVPPVG